MGAGCACLDGPGAVCANFVTAFFKAVRQADALIKNEACAVPQAIAFGDFLEII